MKLLKILGRASVAAKSELFVMFRDTIDTKAVP